MEEDSIHRSRKQEHYTGPLSAELLSNSEMYINHVGVSENGLSRWCAPRMFRISRENDD